jgi:hypothetical protein
MSALFFHKPLYSRGKKISFRKCLSSKNFVNMNFRLLEFSDVCFIFVANLIFMV